MVDEVCFGSSGCALDCWAGANIDGCEDFLILEECVAGVDAVGGEEGFGVEVYCWDVDSAAELLALFYGADEFVWSA